ncbi:MAG: SMC-Scp complex subunit ScpB [Gammaproteobacteria bacterium]|nr:SMC-Scp complex subunit ScpB [Gammaproteobacteria bacterium]
MSDNPRLKQIVEAALLAVGGSMTLDLLQELFLEEERPDKNTLREIIDSLKEDYRGRGVELVDVGGGYRVNVRAELAPWISRLWEERPVRYSRAMLETLALIAYRQPITRGEIEDVRGVSVSTHIIKTMMEREWIRVVGHRDVPGRPALYATTRDFLTYFGLNSLNDLPPLQEIRDLDSINRELELDEPSISAGDSGAFGNILGLSGQMEAGIADTPADSHLPDDRSAAAPVSPEGSGISKASFVDGLEPPVDQSKDREDG